MPTQQSPRQDSRALTFQAYAPLVVGGIIVVLCWIPWLAAAMGNVNVLQGMKPASDGTRTIFLFVGLGATVAGVAVGLKGYQRGKALLQRGVQAQARVLKVGSVASAGMCPVILSYIVDGREYRIRRDVPEMYVQSYTPQTLLTVVYDPENPGQAEITDAAPDGYENPASVAQGIQEGMSEGLLKGAGSAVWVVLLVVNTAVIYGIARLLGAPSDLFHGTQGVPILCGGITLAAFETTAWQWKRSPTTGFQSLKWPLAFGILMLVVTIATLFIYL